MSSGLASDGASLLGAGEVERVRPPPVAPVLRVYRMYSPTLSPSPSFLHKSLPGDIPRCVSSPVCGLGSGRSLELPSTFGQIYVGQEFAAYVGMLNTHGAGKRSVRQLQVATILQPPSGKKTDLTPEVMTVSSLAGTEATHAKVAGGGVKLEELQAGNVCDMVIRSVLVEEGLYTLKVTVRYGGDGGGAKPMRKFYKFAATRALGLTLSSVRAGPKSSLFVSVAVKNLTDSFLTVNSVQYLAPDGNLVGTVHHPASDQEEQEDQQNLLLNLFDNCGYMESGATKRYVLEINTNTQSPTNRSQPVGDQLQMNELAKRGGIAVGDDVGVVMLCWKRSMGEEGRVYTDRLYCPPCTIAPSSPVIDPRSNKNNKIYRDVVYGSGLALDCRVSSPSGGGGRRPPPVDAATAGAPSLDARYPLTVTPVDPPQGDLPLLSRVTVALRVVNHGHLPVQDCRLRFAAGGAGSGGFVPVGTTSVSLGALGPGEMGEARMDFIATMPGLWTVGGCVVADAAGGREVPQPDLFAVRVVEGRITKDSDANTNTDMEVKPQP